MLPLHAAVLLGHEQLVVVLLGFAERFAQELLLARDGRGLTPLHCAATMGRAKILRQLLRAATNMRAAAAVADNDGALPLHRAAELGDGELVHQALHSPWGGGLRSGRGPLWESLRVHPFNSS